MNLGIKKTHGKYIIMLNCGDYFYNDSVLEKVFILLNKHKEKMIILYGNYIRNNINYFSPKKITPFNLFRSPIIHQTLFVDNLIYQKYGLYNTKYLVSADYEFEVRSFFNHKIEFIYTNITICLYKGNGFSELNKIKKIGNFEIKQIRKKFFRNYYFYYLLHSLTLVSLRKFLISDNSPIFIRKLYSRILSKLK